jgi:hypothetical protein
MAKVMDAAMRQFSCFQYGVEFPLHITRVYRVPAFVVSLSIIYLRCATILNVKLLHSADVIINLFALVI